MSKNAQNSIYGFYRFCKKKKKENFFDNFFQLIMDGEDKKHNNEIFKKWYNVYLQHLHTQETIKASNSRAFRELQSRAPSV